MGDPALSKVSRGVWGWPFYYLSVRLSAGSLPAYLSIYTVPHVAYYVGSATYCLFIQCGALPVYLYSATQTAYYLSAYILGNAAIHARLFVCAYMVCFLLMLARTVPIK